MAGIVVEVQLELRPNDEKLYTWPVYAANLRARRRCPVCVLVITPSERVAERARAPIDLGFGSTITPLVVGPRAVPVVLDPEVARHDPELALLSAMAHGEGDVATAVNIARAASAGFAELTEERAMLYFDLLGTALGDAARAAFEGLMAQGEYVYRFIPQLQRKLEARHVAEGRASAKAELLLEILDERGVALSAEQRDRVVSCSDEAKLGRWARRALAIASADELFVD